MAWAYYKKEEDFYKDDFRSNTPITKRDRVEHFVKEICDYYKVVVPEVTYRGRSWHMCYWDPPRLGFTESRITLRFLSHELGHHVENQLNGNKRHNKKLARRVEAIMSRLYDLVFTDADRLGVRKVKPKEDEPR